MKQIFIKIHPKSYVHCILKLNNGLIKYAHDPDMSIPIFNTLNLKIEIILQKNEF